MSAPLRNAAPRQRLNARLGAGLVSIFAIGFVPSAAAHVGTGLPGGFAQGAMHPLSGLDHLLAMVSVGLWGAFLGRPLLYALPVIFPVVMVIGAAMGMLGVAMPPIEIGIALSVLVLGGCIAMEFKAPISAASIIVAAFAVFHGYAHGSELPSAADPIGYSVGFVFATGALHVCGIAMGLLNDRRRGALVVRTIGGVIGGAGVWFLVKAISA